MKKKIRAEKHQGKVVFLQNYGEMVKSKAGIFG
jgi:hypothetical protein